MPDRGAILAGRAAVELSADGSKLKSSLAQAETDVRNYAKMADKYTRQAQAAFAKGNTEQGRAFTQMAMTATQSRNAALQNIGSTAMYGGFRGGTQSGQEGFASRFVGGGRRGPLGHSVREGFRTAGMSGAGGEAGYALMMMSELGLAGGAIAVGVMAIGEGYRIAKEHAEKLREAQERHTESVREAAHFTAKLYQAPTTGLGGHYISRSEELEKSNRELAKSGAKAARSLGLGDTAVILGQAIARGGIAKTDFGKEQLEAIEEYKEHAKENAALKAKIEVENQRYIDQIILGAKKEGVDKELSLLEQRREWIISDAKRDGQETVKLEKAFAAERLAIIAGVNREITDKGRELSDRRAKRHADVRAARNGTTVEETELGDELDELRRKNAPNRGEAYRRQLVKDAKSGQQRTETINEYRQRLYGDADKNTDRDKRREARDRANESVEFEKNLDQYANKERGARVADFARGIRDELKTTDEHLKEYKAKLAEAVSAEEITQKQADLAYAIEEGKHATAQGSFNPAGMNLWGGDNKIDKMVKSLDNIDKNTAKGNISGGPGVQADTVNNPEMAAFA
jgi:hypothetical protein